MKKSIYLTQVLVRRALLIILILSGGIIKASVDVTATGGTLNASYTTLKEAFDSINAGVHTGAITLGISSNINEGSATASLNGSGTGAASYSSILIQPTGGAAWAIQGTTTAGNPMIELNGADNVTIDGLNTGGNSLTIENTTVSGTSGTSTIRFLGDATNNLITNCSVNGASTTAIATNGGTIWFSASAVSTGNDDNTISNCNIGPVGSTFPSKAIYGNGTTTTSILYNSNIVIDNNNIYDYFNTGTHAGIYVSGGNTDWIISNNRFYQTNTRSITSTTVAQAIQVSNTSAENMQILDNTIGFANAAGTGLSTYASSGGSIAYRAIVLSVSTNGTPASVQGNTISGVSLSTTLSGSTTSSPFAGVLVSSGLVNVGNISGNTIGSLDGSSSISVTANNTSTAVEVYGVYNGSSDSTNISNNSIGNITVSNAGTGSIKLYGIRANTSSADPALNTISNNTIGSVSGPLTNSNDKATALIHGIQSNLGRAVITGNTLSNFSCAASNSNATTTASIVGIYNSATANTTAPLISGNTIYSFNNSNGSSAVTVTGILNTGASIFLDPAEISKNLIHTLSANSTAATVNGILVIGGSANYQNNMIRLGTSTATALKINGIQETGSGTNNYYFNTIYIGNTGVASTPTTSITFAFLNSSSSTSTREIQNNIFINARSNSTTGANHYAISVAGTSLNPLGLTSDYNIISATGTGGVFGLYNSSDVADLSGWQSAVGTDANSLDADPCLANPDGLVTLADLHLTNCGGAGSPAESAGIAIAGLNDDFDSETRSLLSPTDIGADAGLYGPAGKDVGISALLTPTATSCHSASEDVVVVLTNFSDPIDFSVDTVIVTVDITGTVTATFYDTLVSGTVNPGDTLHLTLGQINTTANGTYTFVASASMQSDINTGNDTLNTDVIINYTPLSTTASASLLSICGGNATILTAEPIDGTLPYSYAWSPGGATTDVVTVTPSASTVYTVEVTDACGVTASATVSIAVDNQTIASITSGMRCGTGTVDLMATPGGSATIRWYADSVGGLPIGTGTTFTTPVIDTTTVYYVSARGAESTSTGARPAPAVTTTATGTFGVVFDAFQNFEIDSVDIYPASASGDITVELRDAANTTLDSRTVTITGGSTSTPFRIPVGFAVPQGTDYRLVAVSGHPGLVRESSLGGFPYSLGANGDITGSTSGTSYYFFYNWGMTQACESPREPDTAYVNTAPAVAVSISPSDTICDGQEITMMASSSNDPNYVYTWSYDGITPVATGANFMFTPDMDTLVYLTAEDTTGASMNFGCVVVETNQFVVNLSVDTPIISPANPGICPGDSVQLIVTNPSNTLVTATVGPPNNGQTTGYTLEAGLFFDVFSPFTIKGVYIYPTGSGAGTVEIALKDPSGTDIQTYTFNGTGTAAPGIKTFVPINFTLTTPGTGYALVMLDITGGITGLTRDPSASIVGGTFASGNPFMTAPGFMEITSGRCCPSSTSTSYYYFFDWQLEVGTPVVYTWEPGSLTGDSVYVSPTTTTTYTVSGANDVGCSASASVTVHVSDLTYNSSTPTNISCFGGSDGSITIDVTGSYGPFMYSIDNGANYQSSNSFTGLSAGTYDIIVKDTLNCVTAVQMVTLTEESEITFSAVPSDATCFGGSDGSITISGETGGVGGPYMFSIDNGSNYQATGTFTGLTAGSYNVRVKDASGCESPVSVVIIGTTPSTQYTITATAAAGGTITPSGGVLVDCGADQQFDVTPDLCYQIDSVVVDGVNFGAISTYTFTSVLNNHTIDAYFSIIVYTVTATSGINGTISPSGVVNANCGDTLTFTMTPDIGYIVDSVTVDGVNIGSPTSYTFFTIMDNHTIDVTFTDCLNPALADAGPNAAVCAGQDHTLAGSIGGTASSGTWSSDGSGTFNPNNDFATATTYTPSGADITAGSVILTLTTDDPSGSCPAASASMVLTINANPIVNITGTLETCEGSSTVLTASSADMIVSYQWDLNGSTTLGTDSNQTATDIGTYNVLVTDANGCTATASATTIPVDTPMVSINGTSPICAGTSTTLTSSATVSNGTITGYLWYLDGVSTGITTDTIVATTAGSYTLVATSSFGCSGVSAPFVVSNATGPLAGLYTIDTSTPVSCTNFHSFADAFTALNVNGVAGNVTFDVSADHTETAPSSGLVLDMCALSVSLQPNSTQTLTFQKSGVGANPLITAGTGSGATDAIFVIRGVDYLTVDGIDLEANPANVTAAEMTESGYVLTACDGTNGAQHNLIQNCVVTLDKSNTNISVGMTILNGGITPTTVDGANSFNVFRSNTVTNSYYGIYATGFNDASPFTYYDQGNEIGQTGMGNIVTNFGGSTSQAYGILTEYQNDLMVVSNTVNSAGGVDQIGNMNGIRTSIASDANTSVIGNTVTLVSNASATGQNIAIINTSGSRLGRPASSSVQNVVNIQDNVIENCSYTGNTSSLGAYIYSARAGADTLSAYNLNITGNDIKNNTYNTSSTTGSIYGVISQSLVDTGSISNNMFTNNAQSGDPAVDQRMIVTGFGGFGSGTVPYVYNLNISGNTISGNTSTGTSGIVENIAIETYVGSAPQDGSKVLIADNTIGNTTISAAATSAYSCITTSITVSTNATIMILNNTIENISRDNSTSGAFIGIDMNGSAIAEARVEGNTISNISLTGATSGTFTGFQFSGSTSLTSSYTFSGNTLSDVTQSGTGTVEAMDCGNASKYFILGNTIENFTKNSTGTGTFNGLTKTGSTTLTDTTIMSNNVITGNTLDVTSTITLFDASNSLYYEIQNNTVTNNSRTGASGTMYCMRYGGSTNSSLVVTNNSVHDNSVPNTSGTSSSTLYGMYNISSPGISELVADNEVYNQTIDGAGTSTAHAIYGIYTNTTASSNKTLRNNHIHSLMTGDNISGSVYGMYTASGNTIDIYKNKIYNLTKGGASGTIYGLYISSGVNANAFNNYIGNIRAPFTNGTHGLIGIYIAGGTGHNIIYNTIYIPNFTSSGTNFGSSGIYASTSPTVNLQNNIVINLADPVGTGASVAYRRSSSTLTSYDAAADRNIFYAGTPGAANLIYGEGTGTPSNAKLTIADFRNYVTPRDASSQTENVNFLSVLGSDPTFLHINPAIPTLVESGASPISSPFAITDDYDGDTRDAATPDIGADEGTFISAALVISNLTATPGSQCVVTSHLITATVDSGLTAVTSVTLDYSYDGIPQTPIVMSNVGGNQWEATIPAASPSTAIVTYSVTATDGTFTKVRDGDPYQDEYLTGVTLNATATPDVICLGDETSLEAALSNPLSVQIGTGTSTSSTYPYYRLFGSSKTQMMYLASELSAAGLTAGDITAVGFDISSAGSVMPNSTLSMKNTTNTDLSGFESGLTTVYTNASFSPVTGVNMHVFDTPFYWDGTSNIIVEWCFENNDAGGSSSTIRYTNPGFAATYKQYQDNAPTHCSAPGGTTSSSSTIRPNLYIDGNSAPGGFTYDWSSVTVGNGLNATAGNPVTATPTSVGTITYDVIATDANGCTLTASVDVTVNDVPPAPVATNSTQCGFGVPTAYVSGSGGIFNWYLDSIGGSPIPGESDTMLTAYAIALTTTFYVAEFNGQCESDRVAVTVTVTQPDSVTASASPNPACPNDLVSLMATQIGSTYTYTYEWSASPSAGSGLPGTMAGQNINVTPTASGTFTYSVVASDTAAGCSFVATVDLVVNEAPAAIVASNDESVCTGDSVTLSSNSTDFIPTLRLTELMHQAFLTSGGYDGNAPAFVNTGGTTYDMFEITNLGTGNTDPSGITFETWLSTGSTPDLQVTIPAGASLVPPGGSIFIQEGSPLVADLANNYYTMGDGSFDNYSSGTAVGYILRKGSLIIDAVAVNSYSFPAAAGVSASDWSGNIASQSGRAGSVLTADDNNTASSWTPTSSSGPFSSYGVLNPGVTLSIPPNGTVSWTSIPAGFTASTPEATFGPITVNTTFVVELSNGTCSSYDTVEVTAIPLPPAPTANNSSHCGTAVPNCSVTGSGGIFNWYLDSVGGTPIPGETGPSLTSYTISTTTTFYVSEYDGSCESERTAVTETVNIPDSVTASVDLDSICPGTAITLDATQIGSNNTYSYEWSASPVSGSGMPTPLPGQSVMVTPNGGGVFTYSVTATDNGLSCVTTSQVIVHVTEPPVISSVTASPNPVCAGSDVVLTALTPDIGDAIVTIGTGTVQNATNSVTNMPPYGNYYTGTRHQMLLLASDLTAAGLYPGDITSLAFDVISNNNSLGGYTDFTILLGHTAQTAMTTTFINGLQLVYDTALYDPVPGWNTHEFETPFVWDGTSNIVIETWFSNCPNCTGGVTCGTTGSGVSYTQNAVVNQTTQSYVAHAYYYSDGSGCNPNTVATATTTNSTIPNMRIGGQSLSVGSGSFVWTWNPGSLSGNSVTVNPTVTTTYTVTALDTVSGCSSTDSVTVDVNPVPAAPTAMGSSQCGYGVPSASVTGGGGVFNWYLDAVGGSPIPGELGNMLTNYAITNTTTFYVSEFDGLCEGPRTAVTVTVSQPDSVAASTSEDSVCIGSSMTLDATQFGATNTYLFTWTASPEPGSGITGSESGQSVVITPTALGSYTYTVLAEDTAAGCAYISTVEVTVNELPASINGGPDQTVCSGSDVTLSASSPAFIPTLRLTELMHQGFVTQGYNGVAPAFLNQGGTTYDVFEATNLGTAPVDPSGVTFETWNSGTATSPHITVTIPAGASMVPSGGSVFFQEGSPIVADLANNYYTMGYTSFDAYGSGSGVGYILKKNGVIFDAVAVNGFTFPAAAGVTSSDWSGSIPSNSGRSGSVLIANDNNTASSWAITSSTGPFSSYGTINPGVTADLVPAGDVTWTSIPPGFTATTASATFGPLTANTTFVVHLSNGPCESTDTVEVTVLTAAPTPVIASNLDSICNSGDADLMITNFAAGSTVQWQSSTTGTPGSWSDIFGANGSTYNTGTLFSTQYYRVYASCSGSADTSNELQIVVVSPNITGTTSDSRCGPGNITLTVSGTGNFEWYDAPVGGNLFGSGSSLTQYFSVTTTLYAEASIGTCIYNGGRQPATATINPAPTASVAVTPGTEICTGETVTFTATSTNANYTYSWSADGSGVLGTDTFFVHTPDSTTTYTTTVEDTVSGSPFFGCGFLVSTTVSLFPLPATPDIDPSSAAICDSGDSVTLTVLNADTALGTSEFVGPLDPSIGSNGVWTSTAQWLNFSVLTTDVTINTVDIYFTGSVGSAFTIVVRDAVSLTQVFSYSGTITISGGLSTPQTVPINAQLPPGDYQINYSVNPGCYRNSGGGVYPYEIPGILSITGNTFDPTYYYIFYNWNVSTGSSTAAEYVWTPGNISGTEITVSPTVTTTYTVTATNPNTGCTSSSSVTVTFDPVATPTIMASGSTTICEGSDVTLDAGAGYTSYSWSDGVTEVSTSQTYVASPGVTTTYTVIVSNGTCTDSASQEITVLPNPTPTITPSSSTTICQGDSVTLSADSGYAAYSWSDGFTEVGTAQDYTAYTVGTYTVTATSANGCTSTASETVSVNANPPAPVVTPAGPLTLCDDGSDSPITLTADTTGAGSGGTINWNDIFGATGLTYDVYNTDINLSIGGNTYNFIATVTNADGCSSESNAVTIDVITCPSGLTLNLRVFMQGYYIGSNTMYPVLLYQGVPGATGVETDTVYVELHQVADPTIVEGTATALIGTDGFGSCTFPSTPAGNYWIVIKHRNSIQTWSANPVTFPTGTYDFTTAATQAFASNVIDVFGENIWSIYTGDMNQDEYIDIFDFPPFDSDNQNFVSGVYVATDLNGDGYVDIFDFPVFDANNQNFIFSIHP